MARHPFEIGAYYANRRESYEVVAIDEAADQMVIRYQK